MDRTHWKINFGRGPALLAGLLIAGALAVFAVSKGSGSEAGGKIKAQGEGGLAFLPLLLRREELSLLPDPPTARPTQPGPPTATATDIPPSATPGPSPTLPPTPTPAPAFCEGGLERRLQNLELDMDGGRPRQPDRRGGVHPRQPIYLSPVDRDHSWMAWAGTDDKVHITPLIGLERAGPDVTLAGDAPMGLAAREDGGFGVLVMLDAKVILAGYDAGGEHRFDKVLVGDNNHSKAGDKWVDSWGHEGRLAWGDNSYSAYFGHTQEFGANGKHQGDLIWMFDRQGNQLTGRGSASKPEWDWGCSHSLDLRLVYSPEAEAFGPVCLSDCYPSKSMLFRHQAGVIQAEPSGDCSGGSEGQLGGLVARDNGFAFSFASKNGRRSYDIGLVSITVDAAISKPIWLTDSTNVQEEAPHMADYGDDYLLGWREGSRLRLAVYSRDGDLVEGPASTTAAIDDRDDFQLTPGGDVVWAARNSLNTGIEIFRMPPCLRQH